MKFKAMYYLTLTDVPDGLEVCFDEVQAEASW